MFTICLKYFGNGVSSTRGYHHNPKLLSVWRYLWTKRKLNSHALYFKDYFLVSFTFIWNVIVANECKWYSLYQIHSKYFENDLFWKRFDAFHFSIHEHAYLNVKSKLPFMYFINFSSVVFTCSDSRWLHSTPLKVMGDKF